MATTVERLGIVETKVENLSEKMDDLKIDVREMHDCLDKTRDSMVIDLQHTDNIEGYDIEEKLESYNAKSLDKCNKHETIFKVII